jgi:hypothetical protein
MPWWESRLGEGTETASDTVRKTDVEVQPLAGREAKASGLDEKGVPTRIRGERSISLSLLAQKARLFLVPVSGTLSFLPRTRGHCRAGVLLGFIQTVAWRT